MSLIKLDLSKGIGGRNNEKVYTAPNGVVVTSSMPTYSNSNYYWLEYLFDDPTINNYWLTSGAPATLTFDFGSLPSCDIRRIEVVGATRTDSYSLYSIWISDDNINYKEIVPETGSSVIKEKKIFNVNTEKKRFVQFRLKLIGSWGAQLTNIDFFIQNNETKTVIQDGEYYKIIKNDVVETVGITQTKITNEWLAQYGMTELKKIEKIHLDQLVSNEIKLIRSNTSLDVINAVSISGVSQPTIVYSNFNYPILDIKNIDIIDTYAEKETCIPTATTYKTPIGTVIFSSENNGNGYYYAHRLFNKIKDGYAYGWFGRNALNIDKNQWAGFEFNEPTVIQGYGIRRNQYSDYSRSEPVDWTFEGFNGNEWIVLHKVTGYQFKTNEIERFENVNITPYLKYRINITKVKNMNYPAGLDELELYKGFINTGVLKVFYSLDDGLNWYGKEKIDTTNLKDVFEQAFTTSEFKLAFGGIQKNAIHNQIRLAFYLENTDMKTNAGVYGVSLNKAIHDVSPILNDIEIIKNMSNPTNNPKVYVSTNEVSWTEVKVNELEKLKDTTNSSDLKVKVELKDGQEIYAICYSWI